MCKKGLWLNGIGSIKQAQRISCDEMLPTKNEDNSTRIKKKINWETF